MLRSVPMAYCQLYLQPATAFETMAQLGEMRCIQLVDMYGAIAPNLKVYTGDICRCAELEKKLLYIESETFKEREYDTKINMRDPENDPKPIHPSEMIMFENMIEKWENDISETSENIVDMKQNLQEMKELNAILKYIGPMLDETKDEMEEILTKFQGEDAAGDTLYHGQLYVMSGVLERAKSMSCQLMLWRVSLGNIYYRQTEEDIVLDDPKQGKVRKVAFLAACQGNELRNRLEKVCAAFKANIYVCPTNAQDRSDLQYRLDNRILELENVLCRSICYHRMALQSVARQWRGWLIQVRKTKAIYHHLNLMTLDNPKNCLVGHGWVRERDIPTIQMAMDRCTQLMGVRAPSVVTKIPYPENAVVPTVQHTNKFTHASQVLIDAYGTAKYREINPGLFAIVGLPFIFGVMFSDMGHAIILTGIALWLIIQEKNYEKRQGDNEIWNIIFGGRYILLLMGIWSGIAGFCYNQLFSRSINLSESMYKNTYTEGPLQGSSSMFMGANSRIRKPYLWGMDPVWQLSKNKLIVKNSQMMKMSIIIGTLHMMFGLFISIFNYRYFKKYYAIFLKFLPQFLFLTCLFGWTVFLIYFKWWFYYEGNKDVTRSGHCAPAIIPHFLARFIPTPITYDSKCKGEFFENQWLIESFLNVLIIFSILLLLFGTPLYIYFYNARTKRKIAKEMRTYRFKHMKGCKLSCSNPCGTYCDDACAKQEEHWINLIARHSAPFSQLLSTHLIHTLDFLLGVVAHLASYLRIWALSLGHYLISEALWIMVLRMMGLRNLDENSSVMHIVYLDFAFALFAILTVIVLIVMEGLCCFLHALRLHWVEFMSKFYVDEGYAFQPFSFTNVFTKDIDNTQRACASSHVTTRRRKKDKKKGLMSPETL